MSERIEFKPQPGPQTDFLSSEADIVLYGGAAGGGKSFAILLEPLRNIHNPNFGAVCFRRTMPQIKNEGGLWDESSKIYPFIDAKPNLSESFWRFPSGATVSFSHLEHEKNVYDYQGAQIPLIMFDELTHFTRKQFFYMLSRNRSTCGVKPYIRATTNPDKKSWVRNFIDWWIYPKGHAFAGLPIPERAGVVRYFMIEDDKVIWKDSREEFGEKAEVSKSFTFIPAKITDNKILLRKDPGYLGNLQAQSKVERAKLLDGNWDAEEKPGELFQRQWFKMIPTAPVHLKKIVRYWDRAASEKETADWTVGLKMGLTEDDKIVVLNIIRFQGTPNKVEAAIKNAADQDGKKCSPCLEKDPGQAGVMEVQYLASKLSGFNVKVFSKTTDKTTRARPISAQSEVGNVYVVEGSWNEDFFNELEGFPDGGHDDIVDAFSGAYDAILQQKVGTFTDTMTEDSETDKLGEW